MKRWNVSFIDSAGETRDYQCSASSANEAMDITLFYCDVDIFLSVCEV